MKKIVSICLACVSGVALAFPVSAQSTKITGDGTVKSETRDAGSSFTSIGNSGTFHVFVTQGSPASIRVEADENLLPDIITDISGGELQIHTKSKVDLKSEDPMNVYVTLPEVEGLYTSGSGTFKGENHLQVKDLAITVSGEANVDLDLTGQKVETNISGTGQITLQGSSDQTQYSISGQGDVKAFALQTGTCDIHISGMGNAQINARDELNVAISGMGNITYKGSPKIEQHISGIGKISSE